MSCSGLDSSAAPHSPPGTAQPSMALPPHARPAAVRPHDRSPPFHSLNEQPKVRFRRDRSGSCCVLRPPLVPLRLLAPRPALRTTLSLLPLRDLRDDHVVGGDTAAAGGGLGSSRGAGTAQSAAAQVRRGGAGTPTLDPYMVPARGTGRANRPVGVGGLTRSWHVTIPCVVHGDNWATNFRDSRGLLALSYMDFAMRPWGSHSYPGTWTQAPTVPGTLLDKHQPNVLLLVQGAILTYKT